MNLFLLPCNPSMAGDDPLSCQSSRMKPLWGRLDTYWQVQSWLPTLLHFPEPFGGMLSVSWRQVVSLHWDSRETHSTTWRHGSAGQLAVAAGPLASFHVVAANEATIACWRHMLLGSALAVCSSGLLYSNGNSAICSLTAQGQMTCLLPTRTSFHEMSTPEHLNIGKSERANTCNIDSDWGLGVENSRLPFNTMSTFCPAGLC